MSLSTHSLFYFGHTIDADNRYINFKEGGGAELLATLPIGTYSLTRFIEVVSSALNTASALSWSFSVNRTTRIVTINVSSAASILFATGTSAGKSTATLLGFAASDFNNIVNLVGTLPSGKEYRPQYLLQDYKDKSETQKLINATINKSASRQSVSVHHFGIESFYKFDIKYITDRDVRGSDNFYINNPDAVAEAKVFLQWITQKYIVEFMPNEADASTYDRMYLDSSAQDSDGVGYELKERTDIELPRFYDTGLLTFTVVTKES